MRELYDRFQEMVAKFDVLKTPRGAEVDPKQLIPFYESFGMPYLSMFLGGMVSGRGNGQCLLFRSDPNDLLRPGREPSPENMAFPTFIDWLKFYLERID